MKLKKIVVMTIGHSTHSLKDFVKMLEAHGVETIVDVRTIPKSRHNPQFNKDTLPQGLGKIGYVHMSGLGGLRHAKADSLNTGWKMPRFADLPIICKQRNLRRTLKNLLKWPRKSNSPLCAQRPCHGDAIVR
jgi:hypothetical protein